jgi:hypothetical protein
MATSIADENWNYLLSLLPANWEELAKTTGAVRRLRGATSLSSLLRALFLHVGHGCSLRTTSVMGKAAGWINMSDVALYKQLAQCEVWLQVLCVGLLEEGKMAVPRNVHGLVMRLVDSTVIKEPGATGSQYRLLYSLHVPGWQCDHFRLTSARGVGNGESLQYFAINPSDCLLADRGFSNPTGIAHVYKNGGHLIMRLNDQTTPLENEDGSRVELLKWLSELNTPGDIGGLKVWVNSSARSAKIERVPARLCAVRKSIEATEMAKRKLRRKAQRGKAALLPETVESASWVVVITTLPQALLSDDEVLQWYRVRWQIELAFKRMKSLGGVGHLPKKDARSSRAWVYGKLLIALLTEKMQRHAASFSPWGGRWLDQDPPEESLA